MLVEFWRLWRDSLRVARGSGRWWRSPFVWAVALSVCALVGYGGEAGALLAALSTLLLFVAGLLWMGVMVQLALPFTHKSAISAPRMRQDKARCAANGDPLASAATRAWRIRGAPFG